MKLEIKHVAPYLPYGLKAICYYTTPPRVEQITSVFVYQDKNDFDLSTPDSDYYNVSTEDDFEMKLVLRSLSDLTKEIAEKIGLDEITRGSILFLYESSKLSHNPSDLVLKMTMYSHVNLLLKHHFDVHGLIEAGLAIDINTL